MTTRILIVIGGCVIAALIFYLLHNNNVEKDFIADLTNKTLLHDTIYYKVKDELGNISTIHDSGIKPSTLKLNNQANILIKTVKYEYNDGIEKVLSRPVELIIGQNIYNLTTNLKLTSNKIQEKRDHYTVEIPNIWK